MRMLNPTPPVRPAWQRQFRERFPVPFVLIDQDQELAPVLHRQSKVREESNSLSGLGIVSTKKISLKCNFYASVIDPKRAANLS